MASNSDFTKPLPVGAVYDHPEHGQGVVLRGETGWLAKLSFDVGERSVVKSRLTPIAEAKLPASPRARERVLARRAGTLPDAFADGATRSVANDNTAPAETASEMPIMRPSEWQGLDVPQREWWLEGMVPMRQVTILNGDGGVGKSLLALQMAAAGALECETIGMRPVPGRVMYLGAEDEWQEFQRRLADILDAFQRQFSDLTDFELVPMADADALLSVPDRAGVMQATRLWLSFADRARSFQPKLIVLDTAADLFGGDEIKRGQVRQFIGMLRKLAIEISCAVILLAHPSVQGMQSGTGSSGSTAWNNSVRSRLYFTRPDGKDSDPDLRLLTTKKTNYGKVGGEMRLRWQGGLFVVDDGKPSAELGLVTRKAEKVFCKLLSQFNRNGQAVSDTSGTNYAPSKMAKHPDAEGVGKQTFAEAMQRLIDRGEVKIVMEGPPSRQRKKLILTKEDFGPKVAAA